MTGFDDWFEGVAKRAQKHDDFATGLGKLFDKALTLIGQTTEALKEDTHEQDISPRETNCASTSGFEGWPPVHKHDWRWTPYFNEEGQLIFCAVYGCTEHFAVLKDKWRKYKGEIPEEFL